MNMKLNASQRAWVDEAFAKLTPDQKIGQLVCDQDRTFNKKPDIPSWLKQYPVGSVFVGAEIIQPDLDKTDGVRETVNQVQNATGVPGL